jgi:hypothetical protein
VEEAIAVILRFAVGVSEASDLVEARQSLARPTRSVSGG